MEKLILQFALENAVKFKGKANLGAVIGKLIADNPKNKENMKEISPKIKEIIKEVNEMGLAHQIYELKILNPSFFDKKEKEKKDLKPLKDAKDGEVITRLAPEPSKYLHAGHAVSFLINYLYARKYKGKCVLRFEDNNPDKVKQEYYNSMREDFKWLGIMWDKEVIVSEDMDKLQEHADKLVKKGEAYMCFCDREKMSKYRAKGMICSCREKLVEVNRREWEDMKRGVYDEGECVLRLKGSIDSKNMVMRDPVIYRIIKKSHPLVGNKFVAWPMYDFVSAIEEHLCGTTHVFRSNEFGKMRIELQNFIQDLFSYNHPSYVQYSRVNITGGLTQGREIRKLIEEGKVKGWDDPQLMTLKALRRRGILPETLHKFAIEVGMSSSDSNVDWSVIASINRKLLDPKVNRYFFVENPIEIEIPNAPTTVAEIYLHPEDKKRGKRKLATSQRFFVPEHVTGRTYRLMHHFNFKDKQFIGMKFNPNNGAKLIHWVPVEDHVKVEVLMNDGSIKRGVAESSIRGLVLGDIVQFERQFFARYEGKKGEIYRFIFTHD